MKYIILILLLGLFIYTKYNNIYNTYNLKNNKNKEGFQNIISNRGIKAHMPINKKYILFGSQNYNPISYLGSFIGSILPSII